MTERNVIYGLSCLCHPEAGVRYVGLTSQGLTRRLSQHRRDAAKPTANRMHLWMREHEVTAEVLESIGDRRKLRPAEVRWMAHLRGRGADLLNGTDYWSVDEAGVWARAAS